MPNDPKNWKHHAAALKRKRLSNDDKSKGGVGSHIVDEKEMIVQRLVNVATGKSMKYEKMGPQEFVAFPYSEISMENLQKVCTEHFKDRLLEGQIRDILASQNGPSCSKLSHIKNFRLIFVRFITKPPPYSILKSFDKMPVRSVLNEPTTKSEAPSTTMKPRESIAFPKSLSISSMLKLGSAITANVKTDSLELSRFNMEQLKWEAPMPHNVSNQKPF